jgi:predicted small lipoprotein YifL
MSRPSGNPRHGLSRLHLAGVAAVALVVLGAGLGIAGCGKIGPLEQPAPLFGARAKAQYAADRQQAQAASQPSSPRETTGSAERQVDAEPNGVVNSMDNEEDDAPRTTRDVPDPDTQMTTPRDSPVPGEPNPGGPMPSLTPPNR